MIKIESHHAVALLARLRDATHSTSSRHRRTTFNGLRAALKGLNLIDRQSDVIALYEGVDQAGGHWFMAEMKPPERSTSDESESLAVINQKELHAQIELLTRRNTQLSEENMKLRRERDEARDARERFPDTTGS